MAKKSKTQMLPHEWRASTSLAGVYALRMLGMFLVLPVLALHAHGLATHLPKHEQLKMVGMAMAMYGLTQAMFQLPLGILSDKIGRKKVIYIGMAVFAAGSFLAAVADTAQTLIWARAIQGVGAVSAAVTALVADLTREEVRTRAMSMIGLSIGLTFSVSLVLSPILTRWIGVNGLFMVMGILSAACMALVAFYTPNPTVSHLHQDTQAQTNRLGEVLRNHQLLRLNFGIFALQAGLMAIFTALPFALRDLGWDKTEHWKVYLPATLIGLVLMIPAIIIGETRNKLKTVFVSGILLILLAQFALIFSLHSVWAIAAALIIYFIGFNILEASMPSLVSKIAPSDLKGTAMGVYNTLQSIGVFSGGLLGSKMYAEYGFTGVFGLCCVIIGIWLVLAITAPAPLPVKNVVLALPEKWHHRLDELAGSLQNVAGVQTVSFSEDKNNIFIKALQQGFDEDKVKQILTGV